MGERRRVVRQAAADDREEVIGIGQADRSITPGLGAPATMTTWVRSRVGYRIN
jgi:hypothetical protein